MSNQPPPGQGSWQQPPAGPPGQGGPPSPAGPPPAGGYPPGGAGGYPPGGPGGPPPGWGPGGSPQDGPGAPSGKSKLLPILAIIGVVVVLAGGGALLYFLVLSDDDDSEASGGGGGGSGGNDYCTLLEDNYEDFEDMSSGNVDPDQIEQSVGIIHDLRDSAPEELEDEWAQLDDPFRNLDAALDEAGMSWSDLNEVDDSADLPQGLKDAAQQFISDLSSIDQEAVGKAIEGHAREECGLEIDEP